jgi:hypothetical protein
MKSCPIKTAESLYRQAVRIGDSKKATKYLKQYKEAISKTYQPA